MIEVETEKIKHIDSKKVFNLFSDRVGEFFDKAVTAYCKTCALTMCEILGQTEPTEKELRECFHAEILNQLSQPPFVAAGKEKMIEDCSNFERLKDLIDA